MSVQEFFKGLRKWIDGEDDLDEQGKPRPRSKWEDFLVAIAREVEKTMQEEMFTPPGGPTYIPREYIVFLSSIDDADWQGEKREGLQRGLYHVLSERARELVGDREFQTKTFTVELRVDAALEAGKFRVQHLWDNEADKTVVMPRKRVSAAGPTARTDSVEQQDEATIVRPRVPKEKLLQDKLFSVIAIKNAGTPEAGQPEPHPFFKNEITIGRGSKDVAVDLKLDGDLEISRKHATINRQDDGTFTITCQGANPIVLDGGREVPSGETADVKAGEPIAICTYELKIAEDKPAEDKKSTTKPY
jgi:hypothetical protein